MREELESFSRKLRLGYKDIWTFCSYFLSTIFEITKTNYINFLHCILNHSIDLTYHIYKVNTLYNIYEAILRLYLES